MSFNYQPLNDRFFSSLFAIKLKRGSVRLPTHRRGAPRNFVDGHFLK